MKSLLFLIVATLGVNAFADAPLDNEWNGWNDPMKMDPNFERILDKLPLQGDLSQAGLGWPGYYWANNKGGIAHRWRSQNPQNFEYRSPGQMSALGMSKAAINELSPAEKYDLYMGRYDYPTVKNVWSQTREGHRDWYGICHGVSPSSLNHPEPGVNTVYNPDGVEITFFSSDVKALLAYYYAKVSDSKSIQVGKRCFISGWIPILRGVDGCRDVNPAALHIIMANKLGLEKTGFIADMEKYAQVWNHAAVKYESKILRKASPERDSAAGSVERVLVASSVTYAASIDPSPEPVIGGDKAKYETREYQYWLDLDYKGEILGGKWVSGDRPDFLWIKEKDKFSGYWSGLNEVYRANI